MITMPPGWPCSGEGLWRSRFAADPQVVGTTIKLSGQPFAVVGVVAASFKGVVGIPGSRSGFPSQRKPFSSPRLLMRQFSRVIGAA